MKMKKLILLLMVCILTTLTAQAGDVQKCKENTFPKQKMTQEQRLQREAAFDQKLGLTDSQKQQAKAIRMKGHEKIKPLIEQSMAKRKEIRALEKSGDDNQNEKITQLKTELKTLNKQIQKVRRENMKEFESILTAEQKKILQEMKQEGRKNYYQKQKCKPNPIAVPTMPVKNLKK